MGMRRTGDYQKWRKSAAWEVILQSKGLKIKGQYRLWVYVKRHNKSADLDNSLKSLGDLLQHSGVIENDKLCQSIYAEWVETGDDCTVRIESLEEGVKNER